ncbi:MAG: hypothetical protein JNM96_06425, partial [Bacteroidia bacterium]|nr:hypothetical protein [Bacteroidia bacterium]
MNADLNKLNSILSNFDKDSSLLKLNLLQSLSQQKIYKSKEIKAYHNCLLFVLAYPDNLAIQKIASAEMQKIGDSLKKLNETKRLTFDRSGLAYTETVGTFSLAFCKWLLNKYPNSAYIHSFDEAGVHPKEVLKNILPEMEFEIIGNDSLNKINWLKKVSGLKNKNEQLNWLVSTIDAITGKTILNEQMFESLKVYIQILQDDPLFSKSFGKITIPKIYFHEQGLLKKFDPKNIIHKQLPKEAKLNLSQKNEILDVSRTALALLNRETDPITYCTPNNIKVFNLEHGLCIALYSINSDIRLPLESYIGFMMFKNGYPMSYGGAWLFGKRSLIGINIFETFRGGESAFVFAQLLRTYSQAFNAEEFEVEPYQFGKNNPEGIQSGAFWFYHRFGFRPIDKKLFELSESEHQKIISQKGYRSPVSVLKQFTKSNLSVNFGSSKHIIKASIFSSYITKQINTRFNSDRNK